MFVAGLVVVVVGVDRLLFLEGSGLVKLSSLLVASHHFVCGHGLRLLFQHVVPGASRVRGILNKLVIRAASGLLLPVGDVPAWSQALVELGQSAAMRERLGKAARERIRSEYDFDVVGARYEALYAELLGQAKTTVNRFVDVKR